MVEKVWRRLEILGMEQKSELLLKLQVPSSSPGPEQGLVPHFVIAYRGISISTNSGIQRQQYPTAPRTSRPGLLVFGVGIQRVAAILL